MVGVNDAVREVPFQGSFGLDPHEFFVDDRGPDPVQPHPLVPGARDSKGCATELLRVKTVRTLPV